MPGIDPVLQITLPIALLYPANFFLYSINGTQLLQDSGILAQLATIAVCMVQHRPRKQAKQRQRRPHQHQQADNALFFLLPEHLHCCSPCATSCMLITNTSLLSRPRVMAEANLACSNSSDAFSRSTSSTTSVPCPLISSRFFSSVNPVRYTVSGISRVSSSSTCVALPCCACCSSMKPRLDAPSCSSYHSLRTCSTLDSS